MKGKSRQGGWGGEAMTMEGLQDAADGPKNAKITLSFPLSAALPAALTAQNHCRAAPASPSHRRRPSSSLAASKASDEGSLWKLDATTDVKHRPFKPPRHDQSPSSSSSSSPASSSFPVDLTALVRKDIKSPPPLKCSKVQSPDSQFHRFPARPTNGSTGAYLGEGRGERHRLANGPASPSETAKILFNLSTVAYQGQRGGDTERKERASLPGKQGGRVGVSPHGPSLLPPPLHLPPPQPSLPTEALTTTHHPVSFSSSSSAPVGQKPELICGVCHRLFSSASSLTVHMRLHRGGRALSCRHCGKAFIHNKRLQSHEASCRQPLPQSAALPPGLSPGRPLLPIQPKEEPLEEGEVRIEGGVVVGAEGVESSGKAQLAEKKSCGLLPDQEADAESGELLAGDDNHHFVKVVDGHIIYFCRVCERSYMTLSSLKRHSNVHSWRRKYPCHFCDKVFALAEYRTKHEVWHTGERRYQCIFCWDAFATYYNLKTHQKAIHGISPGLISSEKTANGGYKQKVNALKLYRLLPMRSQKRPYKTYSDTLPDGLLLSSGEPLPLPLSLDCARPNSLGLVGSTHPKTVKPDPDAFPDGFPVSINLERGEISARAPFPQADVKRSDREASDLERAGSSGVSKVAASSKSKPPKGGRSTELTGSSVITYGHSKPSVIVHGTTVSSSVIVHSNQVAKSPLGSPCPEANASQIIPKSGSRPNRNHRETTDSHRKRSRDGSDTAEEGSGKSRQEAESGRSHYKSRKSHSRSDSSASRRSSSPGETCGQRGAGPLCQITVRIGEEAIVKRSISETDLRRDKSPHPPKTKRTEPSLQDAKEPRHSHHHHHKHRGHRSSSLGAEAEKDVGGEGEPRRKSPKPPGKVREYYFRQEVREQEESDDDGEDNLWRPYYAYKPKRKGQLPVQKTRSWQRKLHHKRSLRLMRRAERLMTHVNKEAERPDEEEEAEEEEEVAEEEVKAEVDKEEKMEEEDVEGKRDEGKVVDHTQDVDRTDLSSVPSKEKDKQSAGAETGGDRPTLDEHLLPSPPSLPLSTSASPVGMKRRPWSNDNASECGTCGCWFSSSRKRDKHELSHLLEFVCLHCRAPFPSREKLEDHQKTQHPKASEPQSLLPKAGSEEMDSEKERGQEERESRALMKSTSSPGRLSRRALARHTCPQCHKVCKTSSALTRHIRRHELSSSPEREETQPEPNAAETAVSPASKDPERGADQVHMAQSIPVISYLTPDPPSISGECVEPKGNESETCEVKAEHQTVINQTAPCDKSQFKEVSSPVSERGPSPHIINPSPDSPAKLPAYLPTLTPCQPEIPRPAAPPTLQGVLVMSGSDCLDFRTPKKRNLDAQLSRIPSPAGHTGHVNATPNTPMTCQAQNNSVAPNVPMATAPSVVVSCLKREVLAEREQLGKHVFHPASYEGSSSLAQDLRVTPLSRSPSPSEAQDLTMSSMLAREWERKRERDRQMQKEREREMERESHREREKEMERQREMERDMQREMERDRQREMERDRQREMERDRQREMERDRQREMAREKVQHTRALCHPPQEQPRDPEVTLLIPKEEPISPAPSPQRVTQTTSNSPLAQRRPPKSPRRSPTAIDLLVQVNRQAQAAKAAQASHATRGPDRLQLPMGTSGSSDRPSAHALLLPRAPLSEPADNLGDTHRREAEAGGYPVQELPLPLIVPGGYRSGKKQEDNLLVSYPAGSFPFGPLGKMVPNGDLAKLPFYPDPYHLLYAPQLLAYPYNLAALPMALNMMAPGADKVEPLPFLPALFNYAAAAGPYMGAVPHPLVANPSLYNSNGGSSKKQRDSNNGKP